MSLESGLTFFIAILIFAITPGPGVFALLARALVSGAGSCFSLALGMAVSDIVYLVLACYGLAAVAEHWGGLFTLIRFAGAAYLLYLGWKIWTAPLPQQLAGEEQPTQRSSLSFIQGFLISASNPKVILFYIAFLPTFMDLSMLSAADIVTASLITLSGLMLGLMTIAFGAASARQLFRSDRAMKSLNRTAGGIMIAAGGYLAARH